jgi:hypothetical protein
VGDKPLDGVSLAPLLLGKTAAAPDRLIFSHWGRNVSVRTPRFRLDAAGKLYDLTKDPGQERDVSAEHPDIVKQLGEAVSRWKSEVLAELPKQDNRPFPVGYRQFPLTTLPARDGVPHGKVQRSSSAPNCSYFTNWSTPADRITWEIEVATAGKYEAVLHYTCPAADVGSAIELAFAGSSLAGKVSAAHDPPLYGARNDRVPRPSAESFMKDFKPLRLGVIPLDKGRGPLTLRATQVPGKSVMDLRSVQLTLLE